MKPRILTDEEILKASQVDMFLPNGKLDPDCGYLRGRQQVAEAQAALTLKEVGAWLMEHRRHNPNDYTHYYWEIWADKVEAFLRGEWPE